MANAFKLVTLSGVDDSAATVYTCPAATETTIIGLNLANTTNASITASVQVENNDGDNVYVVKDAPIPGGSSLVAVGGDQKYVLNASDLLKVTSSDSDSIDVSMSILEIT